MNPTHIPPSFWIRLNYLFLLSMMIAIAVILSSAMYLQFFYHEIPCPLCLLQRYIYFGIAFCMMLNFRNGYTLRDSGLALLFTVFLLIVSVRQSLLDIFVRPGHQWVGSAIFGIHMPLWSFLISLIIFFAYSLKFCIIKEGDFLALAKIENYPWLRKAAYGVSWFLIFLLLANLVAIFIQCGFQACHTTGYKLLTSK